MIGGLQTCPVITAGLLYNGLNQVKVGNRRRCWKCCRSAGDIDRRSPEEEEEEEEGVEGLRGVTSLVFAARESNYLFHRLL